MRPVFTVGNHQFFELHDLHQIIKRPCHAQVFIVLEQPSAQIRRHLRQHSARTVQRFEHIIIQRDNHQLLGLRAFDKYNVIRVFWAFKTRLGDRRDKRAAQFCKGLELQPQNSRDTFLAVISG